jgi:hypothetical protein
MDIKHRFSLNNKIGQRYPLDETTFDTIDSEIKAYCLGFLYADGSVGHYGGDYSIRIHIHRDDSEILDLFQRCVQTTKPWYIDKRDRAILALSNKRLYESLGKLGIMQAKTFKIIFPSPEMVPTALLHHFIRGYFDGDGSVMGREHDIRIMSVSLISNMAFAVGLQNVLVTEGFSRTKIHPVPSKVQEGKTVGVLHYSGGGNVQRFYDYIYRDATIYLKRKHDRMQRLLALREINNARPRYNKRTRIYLRSPQGEVVEMRMDTVSLAAAPICKLSVYRLAKGQRQQVCGWTLDRVEPV